MLNNQTKILEKAKKILMIFKKNNHQAFFVGGMVRDFLLKKPFHDIDITTSATPLQTTKLFQVVHQVGSQFGTVVIVFEKQHFEITTFRKDLQTLDFRHPKQVLFTLKAQEDVLRRDFTINGLLMDETEQIFDYVKGQQDLKQQQIKTIGQAYKRFQEDALRILRAFSLQAKTNFSFETTTWQALQKQKKLLLNISYFRILQELKKIFVAPFASKALFSLLEADILSIFPLFKRTILLFQKNKKMNFSWDLFLSLVFFFNDKKNIDQWPFSKKDKKKYNTIVLLLQKQKAFDNYDFFCFGKEQVFLAHQINVLLGKNYNQMQQLEQIYNNLIIKKDKNLQINNQDILLFFNKKGGPWLKNIKIALIKAVLDRQIDNNKDALFTFLERYKK